MLGNDLFAARLEQARDLRPGIVRVDKRTARIAERAAPRGIAKQPDDCLSEIVGGVGGEKMPSRFERKPFGADTGRHDGFAHRQRLENLDARAAPSAERHHIDGPFSNRGPHVVERSGDGDSRTRRELANARAGIAADDRERRARNVSADARKNLVGEVAHGVLVRVPVHRAAEHEPSGNLGIDARREERGVDAGGDRHGAE